MKKSTLLLGILFLFLTACATQAGPETAEYDGSAKRTETNCLFDCDSCTTDDKLVLSVDEHHNVKGISTGSCIAYGTYTDPNACVFSDACSWSFDGSASKNSFNFTSCNDGRFRAEGSGTFENGKSSGTVKCFTSDTDSMVLEWTDVPGLYSSKAVN